MTTPEDIDRALWNVLRPQGDPVERRVTVAPSVVDVETEDGAAQISVYTTADGVEVRVGDVQLFVKRSHVALLRSHPPYPISRWSILWEGDLDGPR